MDPSTPSRRSVAQDDSGYMVRILHLVPTLQFGGAERLVVDLATRLSREKFDMQVVTLSRGGPFEKILSEAEVPVHIFKQKNKLKLDVLRDLTALLAREQPDILHTHLWSADVYGMIAARRAGVRRVVSTIHNTDVDEPLWKSMARRWAFGRMERVACLSKAIAEFARRRYKIPAEKMQIIYDGVDAERFKILDFRFKISESFVFGAVARLERQKGIDVLLRAFAHLATKQSGLVAQSLSSLRSVRLVIVGAGSEAEYLQSLAHDLKIADLVEFAGTTYDVAAALQEFNCFVLPSRWEGFGIAALEAMAAGLPVVASRVGGLAEIILDRETGLLAPPENHLKLAEAMQYILDHPDEARRMGEMGRARVREHFTVEKTVSKYMDLYKNVRVSV